MKTATRADADVLQQIREQAGQRFEQLGWPTTRLEEWQYTNLQQLQRRFDAGGFREATTPAPFTSSLRFGDRVLAELVFVDGVFAPDASAVPSIPGLRISTFRNAPAALLEKHFARYADYEQHALIALNTANAQDGIVIEAEGAVEGVVHALFIGHDGFQSFPRNLIVAGRGSQLSVVESYDGSGTYFTDAVTEIVAGDGAVVDHYRLECESREAFHVGLMQIHQERSSSVTSHSIAIGGAIARNDVNAVLAAEGASLVLEGLFLTSGTQHIDNHTFIDHAVPHCESVELYKGVLDDSSRGVFDGRIVVRAGAQKTVSRQTNKNLLLSETAVVDSKPTLEIYNDDVKCNHGSTIGQLEEEPLFYLRSRGIGLEEARSLLVYAFASEIVDRIRIDAVREQIGRALFQQMPGRLPERPVVDRDGSKE